MSFAIRIENLGKSYRLGATHAGSIRDVVNGAWKRVFGRREAMLPHEEARLREINDRATERDGSFWALRNVSFEIQPGEVVGIIGRNGSGKSTLLKILSQITAPTTGRIEIHGRVASLLEVGTGFHPELSGRENVFLNGAILGMTKLEIRRKLDEIVAFAEIEKFIDTPVKRYSSGMYVRLAFAVAAHLEPEIMVVDEVLAVGDSDFQKKCLGKMGEVARGGRTVLFVSHNAQAIRSLCSRAILLDQGSVRATGRAIAVLTQYEQETRAQRIGADTAVCDSQYRRGSGELRFTSVEMLDARQNPTNEFEPGENIRVAFHYECRSPVEQLWFSLILKSATSGELVTSTYHCLSETPLPAGYAGSAQLELPTNPLRPGEYPLYFWLGRSPDRPYDVIDGLAKPLVIYTAKSMDELGYDPTHHCGSFSIPSRLVRMDEIAKSEDLP